jgi:hypothetical protein
MRSCLNKGVRKGLREKVYLDFALKKWTRKNGQDKGQEISEN